MSIDTDDIVAFIRARLDEDEHGAEKARDAGRNGVSPLEPQAWVVDDFNEWISSMPDGVKLLTGPYDGVDHEVANHVLRQQPARVLRGVEVKRRIADEHEPKLSLVEWPHDQTGKGEAWICPRCANAENDEINWNPPLGQAGVFPHPDFATGYVLAPCRTLLLLASEWDTHPDYRAGWAP